jgi:hypothetical protein
MTLAMRPAGIGFGFYRDADGYSVFCGEWCIGRIYENSSVSEDQRWYWTLHAPGGLENLPPSNYVATLEEAQAQFQKSWDAWKAWAKLEETE